MDDMCRGHVNRYQAATGRESLWQLVHARVDQFRTVAAVIAMIVAVRRITAFGSSPVTVSSSGSGSPFRRRPTGLA